MSLEALGRLLVSFALVLLIIGGLLILFGRAGILKMPGDVLYRRGNFTFFFPVVTGIVISIILTLMINLFGWLWRR